MKTFLKLFVWVSVIFKLTASIPKREHFQRTNRTNQQLKVVLKLFYTVINMYDLHLLAINCIQY